MSAFDGAAVCRGGQHIGAHPAVRRGRISLRTPPQWGSIGGKANRSDRRSEAQPYTPPEPSPYAGLCLLSPGGESRAPGGETSSYTGAKRRASGKKRCSHPTDMGREHERSYFVVPPTFSPSAGMAGKGPSCAPLCGGPPQVSPPPLRPCHGQLLAVGRFQPAALLSVRR